MLENLIAAFLLGLASTTHCIGMCGGIAALLGQQSQKLLHTILFHLGRIICYAVLGGSIGLIVQFGLDVSQNTASSTTNAAKTLSISLRLIASALLLLTALYIAKISVLIKHFESLFNPIWRKIQPLTKKHLPIRHAKNAIALGFLWGFLPCGMIYTAISWSVAQQSGIQAGLLMLAFGLGTSPSLLVVGSGQLKLQQQLQRPFARYVLAASLAGFAIYSAYLPISSLFSVKHSNHNYNNSHTHH